jgi:hypothetical protein
MRAILLSIVLSGISVTAFARQQPPPPSSSQQQAPAAQGGSSLAPGEVQQLFDGYAVVQAQEFLGLSEAQFGPFVPRFRAFQETRRRSQRERVRLIQELSRMTSARAGQVPENGLRERLRALRELEARTATQLQQARDAIDETLDIRQQARFRVFEEHIEQRKLQLLMQARQGGRGQRQLARPQE